MCETWSNSITIPDSGNILMRKSFTFSYWERLLVLMPFNYSFSRQVIKLISARWYIYDIVLPSRSTECSFFISARYLFIREISPSIERGGILLFDICVIVFLISITQSLWREKKQQTVSAPFNSHGRSHSVAGVTSPTTWWFLYLILPKFYKTHFLFCVCVQQ